MSMQEGGWRTALGYAHAHGTWNAPSETLPMLQASRFDRSYVGQNENKDGLASASREPESALEILKKRYARGEISKEEFEEKRKDLL